MTRSGERRYTPAPRVCHNGVRASAQGAPGQKAPSLWRRRCLSGVWMRVGYWAVAGMTSPERPAGMLTKEKIPQGCQGCLDWGTGEPIIRCLEVGLSLGVCEAAPHAALTQRPPGHRWPSAASWRSLNVTSLALTLPRHASYSISRSLVDSRFQNKRSCCCFFFSLDPIVSFSFLTFINLCWTYRCKTDISVCLFIYFG